MRTPKTLKALLLSTLIAATTLGASASASQLYFENNDSGAVQMVDVYVDGTLVFDDVYAGSFRMSPTEVASGLREVVVTPGNVAPGGQDLLRTTVNIDGNGTSTLALNWATGDSNVREYSLDLASGLGIEE